MNLMSLTNSSLTYVYCSNLVSNYDIIRFIRFVATVYKQTLQLFLFHLDLILHAGATIFFWNFESKQSLTYKIACAVHLYLPLLQLAWRQIFWFTSHHDRPYCWDWIGPNPNRIGFWHLDSLELGSNWIWISICFESNRIGLCWTNN